MSRRPVTAPIRRIRLFMALPLLSAASFACDARPASLSMDSEHAASYDLWRPSPDDTCSAEIHNRYSVVGTDGKLYPTWHPPIDSVTGCAFGHEHGRDPRGSRLHNVFGPLAFGFVNEQLLVHDPLGARLEDHVGHKVEWENDVQMIGPDAGSPRGVRCDVFTKLHQGSHSGDAFANNLHELFYALDCTDGSRLHLSLLTAIGMPGQFVASCDGRVVMAGSASPANSPRGDGQRFIPDRECIERFMLVPPGEGSNFHTALLERWEVEATIRTVDDRRLAGLEAYFQVFLPGRYFDPARSGDLGHSASVCQEVTERGHRASGSECMMSATEASRDARTFETPASRFSGVKRALDIRDNWIRNLEGPETWYTDAFGGNARGAPFPGSIRQFISRVDTSGRALQAPQIGRDRDYGGYGVRPPN